MSIKPQEEINEESNKTYPQDWTAYNQAQTQEKLLFFELLSELTEIIPKQKYKGSAPTKKQKKLGITRMYRV